MKNSTKGGGGEAYLNSIFAFGDSEIMIDCGAFTGDTALKFAQYCKTYRKIYAFEPDQISYQKLIKNTQNLNITPFQKGVSSRSDTLSFDIQDSGCSNFNKKGKLQIQVEAIDSLLKIENQPITFIKMDIEGSELEALRGAKQTIQKYKPKLAICIYHRKEDLITIPQYIKSLHPDYKIFIRNHQQIPEDTVLYAY
ncbi:FkbM family methyltransferase [Helicobacter pametensis]|uniref:FkbM family methyltransferase n=2 Tax=Helicobacter pametensis TaxID=95149 RepID=UPI0004BCB03C|nr:FkbM family methyltransferase [Helicobacter pametensis]